MCRVILLLVAIKGGGDLASAVAHRLFREGRAVVIVEEPEPRVVRRRMAFAQAVFDGEATVEGVWAVRTASVSATQHPLETREAISLLVDPTGEAVRVLGPAVLLDGRMRKRQRSDSSVAEAPLVIGLGPGFLAGREVGGAAVVARVGGTIRGILKDGVRVTQGQKLVDIDPREEAILTGISPKARAIAEGVAAAIAAWEASPNRAEQPHTPRSDQ